MEGPIPLVEMRMAPLRRHYSLGCLALLLSACAHQPATPPKREPVVLTAEPPAAAAPIPPADTGSVAAAPTITMPREWQHHNGEDYDDLFDRMRAGFAFDEVQEPAIDVQLAWFEHNPD